MASTSKSHRRSHDRHGAAVVEFALTVPILFLLVFGMIEFGRALMVQDLLANAARDGARSAILGNKTIAEIQSEVQDYLSDTNVVSPTVTVSPDPQTAALGEEIKVTVSAPFNANSWLPTPWFLSGINLQSIVTMRQEVDNSPPPSS